MFLKVEASVLAGGCRELLPFSSPGPLVPVVSGELAAGFADQCDL